VMLKRLDQLIYEPPEAANEVSLKKLCRGDVSAECLAREFFRRQWITIGLTMSLPAQKSLSAARSL
jgi:hypothetical protein